MRGRKKKAKERSMEFIIIMVAVLCFLDDFMVISFCCEQQTSQDFIIYLKVHFHQKQGQGGAGASGASFLPLPNRKKPGACTCIALTLDFSMWVCCVVCISDLKWVGRELQTEITRSTVTAGHVQGVCQCCWKTLLQLPQSGSCFITPINSSWASDQ